jgi:hypothetical protein
MPLSLLMLCFAATASAGVITFENLTGTNGDPFTSYSEGGFTVNATAGQWFRGFEYGNPVPDIFAGPEFGITPDTIDVTGGGLFTFGGLDLSSNNGFTRYSFAGFLSGGLVLSQSGTDSSLTTFITIPSTNSGVQIDSLFITLSPGGDRSPSSYNIDNINVTANAVPVVAESVAPEPGSGLLLATALVGGLVMRRPRNHRKT